MITHGLCEDCGREGPLRLEPIEQRLLCPRCAREAARIHAAQEYRAEHPRETRDTRRPVSVPMWGGVNPVREPRDP